MFGKFVLKYLVVPKAPKVEKDKIRIACIGDSITYGAGVTGKNYKRSTWEYFLQQKLGDDYQVLNYGISGRTLQNEGDYPYRKEKFYRITHKTRQRSISSCSERTTPSLTTGILNVTETSSAALWQAIKSIQISRKYTLWLRQSALWTSPSERSAMTS